MSHTAVDSEISSIASCGSRNSSSVEAEGIGGGGGGGAVSRGAVSGGEFSMAIAHLRGQLTMNGENNRVCHVGDWQEERETLLIEILECQRRIQVYTHIYKSSPTSFCLRSLNNSN